MSSAVATRQFYRHGRSRNFGLKAEGFPRVADRIERTTKLPARGVHRVREIDHFDADRSELALELHALLGAAPVIALEEDVESDLAPRVQLVGNDLGARLIDLVDVRDDFEPFGQRD